MVASQNGHTKVAELLLKVNVDVNIQQGDGWTALMLASKNGHTKVAELLLKRMQMLIFRVKMDILP